MKTTRTFKVTSSFNTGIQQHELEVIKKNEYYMAKIRLHCQSDKYAPSGYAFGEMECNRKEFILIKISLP